MNEVKPQDREQHQKAAGLGKDEELVRSVYALLMPPDINEEVHRHEHKLPEEIEQEEIEREEHSEDARQDKEQVQMKEPDAVADLCPGTEHGQDAEK